MRGICMDVRDENPVGGRVWGAAHIYTSFAEVSFTRLQLMEMRLY